MVSGENFTVRAPKCRADYKQRLRQAQDGPNVITDRSLYYAWVQNVTTDGTFITLVPSTRRVLLWLAQDKQVGL